VAETETETVEDLPTPAPSAPEVARTAEQSTLLRAALARLPGDQRRAIELAFLEGLSQTEIATALNEPLGTIKARIRRGMQKLRTELEQVL
jgi:RNA polymerase sigma-70 factor, ECF subfamily